MVFQEYAVPEPLSSLINSANYTAWEPEDPRETPLWLLPHGGAALHVILQGRSFVRHQNTCKTAVPDLALIGPFTKAMHLFIAPGYRCVEINLQLEGLFRLTGEQGAVFRDRIIDMERNCSGLFEKLTKLKTARGAPPMGELWESLIGGDCFTPPNSSPSGSLRKKQRDHKALYGMSRQEYRRCRQFLDACLRLQRVKNPEELDWPGVYLTAGYYDQSHFIRRCRRITGLPPRSLYTSIRDLPLDSAL